MFYSPSLKRSLIREAQLNKVMPKNSIIAAPGNFFIILFSFRRRVSGSYPVGYIIFHYF
jgi:hypothetical protein